MKILILGKNGYVSKCFQEYMQDQKDYIVEAISVRDGSWRNISFKGYDAVFNSIGLAHNDARKGTDDDFIKLNVKLPAELALKAKRDGVPVFIHMSSMLVYGNANGIGKFKPIDEFTVPQPDSIYGKSKYMGELELKKLEDETFNVALIRSPRVYGENDTDSIHMLTQAAKKMPIFPKINNCISMIYSDNLCELIRLIAVNKQGGFFFPQQEEYICTSKMVKDISIASGHRLVCTKLFNSVLRGPLKSLRVVSKAFGSEGYDLSLSNHFDGKYRVVSYTESIERLANSTK